MKKRINYITYAPQHANRAKLVIAMLRKERPGEEFTGRQAIGFGANPQQVDDEIRRSSTTIVLAGVGTFANAAVDHDIRASRAKAPPNEILIICFDDQATPPEDAGSWTDLEELGTETVGVSGDIGNALDRLHIRVRKGERIAASVHAPSRGGCPR